MARSSGGRDANAKDVLQYVPARPSAAKAAVNRKGAGAGDALVEVTHDERLCGKCGRWLEGRLKCATCDRRTT